MTTLIRDAEQITLPPGMFKCPKCGAAVVLEEVTGWVQADNGDWLADEVHINCETEPDIDGNDWDGWHRWHWDMPYAYWLPLSQKVERWINEHYRWELQ